MTPADRNRAAKVLRRPGMPAAGEHARLLLRIADRPRPEVRRTVPMPTVEEHRVARRVADLGWGLLFFCALVALAMLAERGGL